MSHTKALVTLRVSITRWHGDAQPGWVECVLTDAHGRQWSFIEKAPVVSSEDLDVTTSYPRSGVIACQLIEHRIDDGGQELVVVDTTDPWGVEATSGETQFEVRTEQVSTYECT